MAYILLSLFIATEAGTLMSLGLCSSKLIFSPFLPLLIPHSLILVREKETFMKLY